MELSKNELDLISLALFRLIIEKKALLEDRKDTELMKMIEELKELSEKINDKRLSR
ncbi:hypothetical protein [Crassaminicella profunda]|uniref:hypothetical protein n=1 Tax=Crassaminicella profunda TaxID=1286698 RepID=UPI001CA7B003|nr:hypothetical protein [Crassaminicella profunda]QZY56649.1 hypothetical protein K7H06_06940 [Crassaminicella profunda]